MFASRAVRLTVLGLAIATAYGASRQIRVATDAHLNYLQTRALALHGDIDLARYGDQEGFVTRRDRHVYSVYGVGVSVLPAPLYAVLVRAGARPTALHAFGSIPFAVGAALAMFVLLHRLFGRSIAIGGMLVFAFGTTLWPVGTTAFWQQAQVAMLTTLGLLAFFSAKERAPMWAGLALGWAVLVRPPTAILFTVVGLWYLVHRGRVRSLALYAAGSLLPIAMLFVSNRWIWGSWIGGYGTVGVGFQGRVISDVGRLLFGWWRGLLPYSPVLVLAAAGAVVALVRRKDPTASRMLALAVASVATVLLYARWTVWWGGANQFGYRLLLEACPSLIVLSAYAVHHKRIARPFAIALGVISIATMAAGSVPDKFWWDQSPKPFARSLDAAPLGRAWAAVLDDPLPWLFRLALVGLVAVVAVWVIRATPTRRGAL